MTKYTTLPNVVTIHGTFSFTLWSDTAGLTIPTIQTIKSIGNLRKCAKITLEEQEFETLEIEFADDYSTYAEGFWFKVMQANWELRIYLDEGSGDKFFFFGYPLAQETRYDDLTLSTSIKIHHVVLMSLLAKSLLVTMDDLITEIKDNDVATGETTDTQPTYVFKIKDIFSALLSASATPLNSSYDSDDTTFVYGTQDFIFYDAAADDYQFDELYLATQWYDRVASVDTLYFKSGDDNYLPTLYADTKVFIRDILRNFGLVLVHGYDLVNERHLIELRQQRRAYSGTISFNDREKKSSGNRVYDKVIYAGRATKLVDAAHFVWFWNLGKYTGAPEDWVEFDIDWPVVFQAIGSASYTEGSGIYAHVPDIDGTNGNPEEIIDVDYYSYYDADYKTAAGSYIMEEAVVGYQALMLNDQMDNRVIHRTYGKITADDGGESFQNADLLKRTSIDDGTGAATYFINTVETDINKSEIKVEWIVE